MINPRQPCINPQPGAPMRLKVMDNGRDIYTLSLDGDEWLADGYTLRDVIRLMAGMPIVR